MNELEKVVSGIRPTGNLHLGNYYGAIRSFVEMQKQYNCYFFIADWHSLTTHPHPDNIVKNSYTILSEYLACGVDPDTCTIYLQSDVSEVLELYLYLNMNAYLGELERTTSFKEKARKQPDNVNAGLLTYPSLMAADILIHKANKVPVGKDQEQNMEMARKFARRFNTIYGVDYFVEPQSFHLSGHGAIKIPGLDGSGKMGKSEGNAIYLAEDEKSIRKKVMRAVTDPGPVAPNSEKSEAVANLFSLLKIVSSEDIYNYFDEAYNNCSIRYGDLKKQLAEDIIIATKEVRERIKDISSDEAYLDKVLEQGKEKAKISAQKTLRELRDIIGFGNKR